MISTRDVTLADMLSLVKDFQYKFNQGYTGPPRELPASLASFRKKITVEEAGELGEAFDRGELDEMLDACMDLLYVVMGNLNQLGMAHLAGEAFYRVHRANMKKMLVVTRHESKRDSTWDIVKPEGWTKPDLSDLVRGE